MSGTLFRFGSPLEKSRWINGNLSRAAMMSPLEMLMGDSKENVIWRNKSTNVNAGQNVVFNMLGFQTGGAVLDDETATDKAEKLRLFSDSVLIRQQRFPTELPSKYTASRVGRAELASALANEVMSGQSERFITNRDQQIFDQAQGLSVRPGSKAKDPATHTKFYDASGNNTFGYAQLVEIDALIQNGSGAASYTIGGKRLPLRPYRMMPVNAGSGLIRPMPCYVFLVDTDLAAKILSDSQFIEIAANAGNRGDMNRLFKGYIGQVGSLIVCKVPPAHGRINQSARITEIDSDNGTFSADASARPIQIQDSQESVEVTGLRQMKDNYWTGQDGFDSSTGALISRGCVLGASAFQYAIGMEPTFTQELVDGGNITKTFLNSWFSVQATKYQVELEGREYNDSIVGGVKYGIVNIDVKLTAGS